MKAEKVSVEIPKTLAEEALKLGKMFGYTSVTEFARDAMNRRIEELRKIEKTEKRSKD